MIKLGVNVDHVATVRQARGGRWPDPVAAALLAERAGADGITVHLREDRRHIQDRDVRTLLRSTQTKVNLEMAITPQMVDLARRWKPTDVCLVPEKREELTTEGGLNVIKHQTRIAEVVKILRKVGIQVSLFVDPEIDQINAAVKTGADAVELHTGRYADATNDEIRQDELTLLRTAVGKGRIHGLIVNAGHGLNYHNVEDVAAIPGITELNIGHAMMGQAMFVGMAEAVREMKRLMREAALYALQPQSKKI